MSTRAVYTFFDHLEEYHVYAQHDGYPAGAAGKLARARELALEEYKAGEFAAAFVAGSKSKTDDGSVSLTNTWRGHWDISYRYEIYQKNGIFWVKVYSCSGYGNYSEYEALFEGTWDQFRKFAEEFQE